MGTDCTYKYKLTNAPGQDNHYKMEIKEIWYIMVYVCFTHAKSFCKKRKKISHINFSHCTISKIFCFVIGNYYDA